MLILARKIGESIQIADNIIVQILNVDRNVVKVGIKAPPEVPVIRPDSIVKHPKREDCVQG